MTMWMLVERRDAAEGRGTLDGLVPEAAFRTGVPADGAGGPPGPAASARFQRLLAQARAGAGGAADASRPDASAPGRGGTRQVRALRRPAPEAEAAPAPAAGAAGAEPPAENEVAGAPDGPTGAGRAGHPPEVGWTPGPELRAAGPAFAGAPVEAGARALSLAAAGPGAGHTLGAAPAGHPAAYSPDVGAGPAPEGTAGGAGGPEGSPQRGSPPGEGTSVAGRVIGGPPAASEGGSTAGETTGTGTGRSGGKTLDGPKGGPSGNAAAVYPPVGYPPELGAAGTPGARGSTAAQVAAGTAAPTAGGSAGNTPPGGRPAGDGVADRTRWPGYPGAGGAEPRTGMNPPVAGEGGTGQPAAGDTSLRARSSGSGDRPGGAGSPTGAGAAGPSAGHADVGPMDAGAEGRLGGGPGPTSGGYPAGTPADGAGAADGAPDAPWLETAVEQLVARARLLGGGGTRESGSGGFGRTDVVIDLVPAHLGRLRMRLALEGGRVSAEFTAANPEVREAITSHLGDLRTALADRGLEAGSLNVRADSPGTQGGPADRAGGRPDQGRDAPEEQSAAGAHAGARTGYAPGRGDGRQLDFVA